MQKDMKISVVIPCYNAEKWIVKALESVASQTYPPHEVIVVDDGSSDHSVEKIQTCNVEVKLLHTQRANGAGARNAGIRASSGDWIAFLDADDIWYENHLERFAGLIQKTEDVAYTSHFHRFFNETPDKIIITPVPWPIVEPTSGLTADDFVKFFALRKTLHMPACVIRKDILVRIGGLDESFERRHDIEMWFRVIGEGTWSYDPVATGAFRCNSPGSISRSGASAALFFLMVMLKNREVYPGKAMDRLVREFSRSAILRALTDGDASAVAAAWEKGAKYLSKKDKIIFSLARGCPSLFRGLISIKRKHFNNSCSLGCSGG